MPWRGVIRTVFSVLRLAEVWPETDREVPFSAFPKIPAKKEPWAACGVGILVKRAARCSILFASFAVTLLLQAGCYLIPFGMRCGSRVILYATHSLLLCVSFYVVHFKPGAG